MVLSTFFKYHLPFLPSSSIFSELHTSHTGSVFCIGAAVAAQVLGQPSNSMLACAFVFQFLIRWPSSKINVSKNPLTRVSVSRWSITITPVPFRLSFDTILHSYQQTILDPTRVSINSSTPHEQHIISQSVGAVIIPMHHQHTNSYVLYFDRAWEFEIPRKCW